MLLPILACLLNCTPPALVSVEAHAKSAPAPGTQVALMPSDPRVSPSDPVYLYLAKIVAQALVQQGFRLTPTADEDHAVVAIGWLREEPKVTERALPTLESGNFRGVPPGQHPGTLRGFAGEQDLSDLSPSNDPVGSKVQKTVRYPWTIQLKGLDTAGPEAVLLWAVTATSDSPSKDATGIAPELIAASLPFIGTEATRKDIKISAADAAVKSLAVDMPKAGAAPPANASR